MPKNIFLICFAMFISTSSPAAESGLPALKPIFRDPIHDGGADSVVIWNPSVKRWWMFYTNRRATATNEPGVAWVHGTKIGIAESTDNGALWNYIGTAEIELPAKLGGTNVTHWALEIFTAPDGAHHMFLTVVARHFSRLESSPQHRPSHK